MLTTTIFATKAPKLIAPAMNTNMWENPILQDNLKKLEHYGYQIIQPASGRLACGDTGSGKLPSEETLLQHILLAVAHEKDMEGLALKEIGNVNNSRIVNEKTMEYLGEVVTDKEKQKNVVTDLGNVEKDKQDKE